MPRLVNISGTSLTPRLLLLIGLIASLLAGFQIEQSNRRTIEERFAALSQRTTEEVLRRFHTYEYGLRGARGAIIAAGPENITRQRFLAYSRSRDPDREFPGSRGYGFIRKIAPEQRESFEKAARQDDKPDFRITQLTPHQGDLFVIQYIEPEARNWQAVGLDIASESRRRLAALTAARENRAILTKPITLVQANGQQGSGFLLLLPVFTGADIPQTPEARWQHLAGWAYTPLVVNEVLAGFDFQQGRISLALADADYAETPEVFYDSAPGSVTDTLPMVRLPTEIYGREWLIEVRATPIFISQLNLLSPMLVGALIALISLLLAGLLHVYLANRQRQRQSIVEKSRLAAIVRSSTDAIIGKDLTGRVLAWNMAAEKMLGYSAHQALGKTISELIVPKDMQSEERQILDRIGKGEAIPHFHTRRRTRDGREIDVSLTVSPIRSADNEVIGAASIIRDITVEKANEARILELNASLEQQVAQRTEELDRARRAAEAANQAKSEFIANMSHEIRSPLNAILGLVYLLQRQQLPDPAPSMIAKISSSGRTLLGIINDILDFSKIEARRLDLECVAFSLDEVLDKLADILAASLGEKDVEIVVEPAPSGAEYLRGDALRLGQILINLAGNAIKFTEKGEVVVAIRRVDNGERAGHACLRFSVRDTGIGIPEDKQQSIFDSFSQADSTTTRNFGGTGLGLTISRRLVEMMGGSLSLESIPGQGSTFSFTLDFETTEPTQNAQREMTHQRLLIADDHEVALGTLGSTAASLGWLADTVNSGDAALRASRSGREYDVILLDWRMPGIDGLATAKGIRESSDATRAPIIILVTAQERQTLAGQDVSELIDGVLTKPVTGSSLFNAVLEAKRDRGLLQAYVGGNGRRLDGLHLLVVDDSEINRDVAQQILEHEGARISLACNGEEALECLARLDPPADLVLMDVQMPVLDGYEATRRIRANPRLAHLPVIALTAGAFRNQQDSAMDSGMDDFVAKPFDVETLIHAILRQSKRHAPLLPTAPPPQPGARENTLQDRERALKTWLDETSYRKHLQLFVRDHARDAETINRHLQAGEALQARAIAHRLCGVAGSLALLALAEQARQLETALRQEDDDAGKVAGKLDEVLEQTIALLAADEKSPATGAPPATASAFTDDTRTLLTSCLALLDTDDPGQLEPLLPALAKGLSRGDFKTLEQYLDNFDFRGAEALLRNWLDHPEKGS